MILQLRIDERLAHGQVCTAWLNTLGATHLLVANDKVAGDSFQKSVMSMGIPAGKKSIFCTLEKAVGILNDPRAEGLKLFVIVNSPKDALYLVEHVPGIREVNLANYGMSYKPEGEIVKRVNASVVLDQLGVDCLRKIQQQVSSLYSNDIVGKSKTGIGL